MCSVSMISGHYQTQWPGQLQWQAVGLPEYQNYAELIRKARLYDEMMKQPDCPDPKKEEWMKSLDAYMKERYGLEPRA